MSEISPNVILIGQDNWEAYAGGVRGLLMFGLPARDAFGVTPPEIIAIEDYISKRDDVIEVFDAGFNDSVNYSMDAFSLQHDLDVAILNWYYQDFQSEIRRYKIIADQSEAGKEKLNRLIQGLDLVKQHLKSIQLNYGGRFDEFDKRNYELWEPERLRQEEQRKADRAALTEKMEAETAANTLALEAQRNAYYKGKSKPINPDFWGGFLAGAAIGVFRQFQK